MQEQTLSIIKPDAVERNLENEIKKIFKSDGFKILKEQEGKGLAKFGNDDPVVIRLEAVKK